MVKEKPQGIDPLMLGLENEPGIKEVVKYARRCDFNGLTNIFGEFPNVDLDVLSTVAHRRLDEIRPQPSPPL